MKITKEKKKRNSAFLIAGIIILSIGFIIFIQPHPREVREAYGSYSMNVQMTLVDELRNNTLYGNNTTVKDPSVVYNSISKSMYIIVQINYFNSLGLGERINYTYSSSIISSSPSWQKTDFTTYKTIDAGSGYSDTVVVPVNVTSNLSYGQQINKELGFSTGSSYSILISSRVSSNLGSSQSNLTISIGGATDSISGPNDAAVSGSYFRNAVIPGKIIIPLNVYYSYPLFAVSLVLLGYFVYTVMPPSPDPITKFRKENSENLVELESGPPEGSIRVQKTDDIFKMASFVERPVFVHENIIFIEVDGKTYYAEIGK